MKDKDWQNVFGRADQEFLNQVDEAIGRIEEEKSMKKRYKISTILIAAALIALMTGAALAAGIGLIEGINKRGLITVPDSARELIESDLGRLTTELFELKIEEAIMDGRSAFAQVRLTPKNPEEYSLLESEYTTEGKYSGESEYIFSKEGIDVDGSKGALIGRKDGKKIIRFNVQMTASMAALSQWDIRYNEDGSVTLWMEGDMGYDRGRIPEQAPLSVDCWWGVHGEFDRDDAPDTWNWLKMPWLPQVETLKTQITNSVQRRAVSMVQAGESENGKLSLLGGSIEFSPIKGYYSFSYAYEGVNEDMWLLVGFSDAEGSAIGTLEGREHDEENYTEATGAMQTFDPIPESIYLDVFDLMQDKKLVDRVRVRLVEIE